jgi:hypothetical protein
MEMTNLEILHKATQEAKVRAEGNPSNKNLDVYRITLAAEREEAAILGETVKY